MTEKTEVIEKPIKKVIKRKASPSISPIDAPPNVSSEQVMRFFIQQQMDLNQKLIENDKKNVETNKRMIEVQEKVLEGQDLLKHSIERDGKVIDELIENQVHLIKRINEDEESNFKSSLVNFGLAIVSLIIAIAALSKSRKNPSK